MLSKTVIKIIIFVMIALFLMPLLAMPGLAAEPINGAQIFEANCAGCHLNGGNIIRRGKNLKQRAMTKHGFTNVAAIADLVTHGKGNMSAYGEKLSTEEIQAVAEYVLEQSQRDWRS